MKRFFKSLMTVRSRDFYMSNDCEMKRFLHGFNDCEIRDFYMALMTVR